MAAVKETKRDTSRIGAGKPGPGRPKGVQNKINGLIKEAIFEALADESDPRGRGAAGYFKWLKWEEPAVFGGIVKQIMPRITEGQLQGDIRITVETGMGDAPEPGVN